MQAGDRRRQPDAAATPKLRSGRQTSCGAMRSLAKIRQAAWLKLPTRRRLALARADGLVGGTARTKAPDRGREEKRSPAKPPPPGGASRNKQSECGIDEENWGSAAFFGAPQIGPGRACTDVLEWPFILNVTGDKVLNR